MSEGIDVFESMNGSLQNKVLLFFLCPANLLYSDYFKILSKELWNDLEELQNY